MGKFLQLAINSQKEVVSIYRVPTGKNCNCTCPECGEELVAKNEGKTENTILTGQQKIAHFAHASGRVCDSAGETALHLLAKEVIKKNKTLTLYYEVPCGFETELKTQTIIFDSVETEREYTNGEEKVRPDAILKKGNRTLFVEFYKTHAVDETKKEKLKKIGISTIEIDINSIDPIKDGVPNESALQHLFEDYFEHEWDWIFNPKQDEIDAWQASVQEFHREQRRKQIEFEEKKRQEEIANQEEYFRRKKLLDEEKRLKIRDWKERTLEKGYVNVKVYKYGSSQEETVHCPKENRHQNKKILSRCEECEFYFNVNFNYDEKFVFCGYKAGLKTPKIHRRDSEF